MASRAPHTFPRVGPRGIIKPVRPILDLRHPLSRGIVGCWLLGDTGAGITKDIASGNNGTLTNGPTLAASHHGGMALSFDGTNDFVKTAADTPPAATIPKTVTISARVRTGSSQFAFAEIAGRTYAATHTTPYYAFSLGAHYTSDGKFYAGVNNNVIRAFSYATNTWYHLCYTYDGTTQTLYVNGQSAGSNGLASGAISYGSGGFVSIGANANGAENFNGYIEGVRIYNRVLSLPEIQQLYAEPYAGILDAARPMFRGGAAAAGGAFNPGWATGATRTVGAVF